MGIAPRHARGVRGRGRPGLKGLVLVSALALAAAPEAHAGLRKLMKKVAKVAVVVATAPVTIPLAEAKQVTKATAAVTKPLGPIGEVAEAVAKVVQRADGTTTLSVTRIDKATGVAVDQTSAELRRASVNVGEAFKAMETYAVATALVQPKAAILAARSLRERQFARAVWQLAYSPLQQAEANAARLTAESSLANDVAAVAASAYGGPSGAAAYTAWHTYHASGGNLELAIRAGLLTGASNYAFKGVGAAFDNPGARDAALQTAQKAIAVAAIGGATVAAAGGNSRAVLDGFLRAGAMVLIQDGYRAFTNGDLVEDDKLATKAPICISAGPGTRDCAPPPNAIVKGPDGKPLLTNGKPTLDTRYLDHTRAAVGLASDPQPPAGLFDKAIYGLTADNGPTMKTIAFTVPGANAFSLFHDQWVAVTHMEGLAVQASILPAIVLVYNGTAMPVNNAIETAVLASAGRGTAQAQPPRDPALDATARLLAPFAAAPPDDRDPVRPAVAYACQSDQKQRSIEVHLPLDMPELQCAVLEVGEGKSSVPWYAHNDAGFCRAKAEQRARELAAAGWVCVVRDDDARTETIASIR